MIDLVLLWCETWVVGSTYGRTPEAGQGKAGKKGKGIAFGFYLVYRCNANGGNIFYFMVIRDSVPS